MMTGVAVPAAKITAAAATTAVFIFVHAIIFNAPLPAHALAPNCDAVGELRVAAIGSPPQLYDADDSIWLSLVEPVLFGHLLAPRPRAGHKGSFGHVLAIAGSRGKTGAEIGRAS